MSSAWRGAAWAACCPLRSRRSLSSVQVKRACFSLPAAKNLQCPNGATTPGSIFMSYTRVGNDVSRSATTAEITPCCWRNQSAMELLSRSFKKSHKSLHEWNLHPDKENLNKSRYVFLFGGLGLVWGFLVWFGFSLSRFLPGSLLWGFSTCFSSRRCLLFITSKSVIRL